MVNDHTLDDQPVKYLIYTKDNCPYCKQARALLEYYGAKYELVYERAPDWDTYPGIYKISEGSRELIGGFTELARYSYENKI